MAGIRNHHIILQPNATKVTVAFQGGEIDKVGAGVICSPAIDEGRNEVDAALNGEGVADLQVLTEA